MIITLFLMFIVNLFAMIMSILPTVNIPDSWTVMLIQVVQYWNEFRELFPFMNIVWTCFLWLIAFEIGLIILKVFLGSRAPVSNN